jgi:hypothetical protein
VNLGVKRADLQAIDKLWPFGLAGCGDQMRNYLVGLMGGAAVAGLGLGTVSYLVPARVEAPQIAPAQTEANEPQAAAPEPAAPEPAAPEPAAPEPATSEPAAPAPLAPKPEALLDAAPAPTVASLAAPEQLPEQLPEKSPAPAPESGADSQAKTQTPPKDGVAVLAAPKETPAPPAVQNTPPLQRYAAAFDGGAGKPLFAIVIMDTGSPDVDRAVWASLPLPLSFAVDPESETAPAAMALYRAGGKEVIMLPKSLPAGAIASDVEASFAAYNAMLPETVAVMSAPDGGFQDDRALAALVIPAIGAQGRGAVLIEKGLNTAGQIAQREAIPYAAISRSIDGGGESVPVMRRYLDRAVFQAAQDGAAVVMGSTLPDTLTALTEWAVEGRAGDVALAPISALMKPGE